jgi:hypothetical protein
LGPANRQLPGDFARPQKFRDVRSVEQERELAVERVPGPYGEALRHPDDAGGANFSRAQKGSHW